MPATLLAGINPEVPRLGAPAGSGFGAAGPRGKASLALFAGESREGARMTSTLWNSSLNASRTSRC
jgi:hypothetical protein